MDDKKKLHCALWLQSCSRTHKLWCDCPLWTSHIKGWQGSGESADGEKENSNPGGTGQDGPTNPDSEKSAAGESVDE
nr:ORF2 [Torque teno felis virus]